MPINQVKQTTTAMKRNHFTETKSQNEGKNGLRRDGVFLPWFSEEYEENGEETPKISEEDLQERIMEKKMK